MLNYCHRCGGPLADRVPPDDERTRRVCTQCGEVHYENPIIVTGCIVETDEGILLCKRAIEPAKGWWTLPAGFLENEETVAEGAARETYEEIGARVQVGDLFSIITLIHVHQVYMIYRATLIDPDYGPTSESLEVQPYQPQNIPWEKIAFSSIKKTLRLYTQDLQTNHFQLHQAALPEKK